MEVMFNPASLQEKHAIAYSAAQRQAINTPGKPAEYAYTPPGDLSLQFVLDGTGVPRRIGAVDPCAQGRSVKKDIAKFEKLCLKMNGDIHEPNFLSHPWGDFEFFVPAARRSTSPTSCSTSRAIRSGPSSRQVRRGQERQERSCREAGKNSPDLTHVRVVKSGDTLPLLCKEIYGSAGLLPARRAATTVSTTSGHLTPGQKLVFRR